MKYYRAYVRCGEKKKDQYEKVMYIQVGDSKAPMSAALDIVRKVSFSKLFTCFEIEREAYYKGVSESRV